MAEDPEALKREIEQTRRNVGRDVDALTEKVSPSRVVGRRLDRARGGARRMKDNVMGSAESAPDLARARTRGTPLATGLIAFAAGWVVAAAVPASTRERELAQDTKDKAMEAAGPVQEQAAQLAQEVKDNLQEPAQQAVQNVKQSASEAATEVADEGRSAAQQVADDAKGSAGNVRQAGS